MPEDRETTIAIAKMQTKLENIDKSIKEGFVGNKEDHDLIRKEITAFKEEIRRDYIQKVEIEPMMRDYGKVRDNLILITGGAVIMVIILMKFIK